MCVYLGKESPPSVISSKNHRLLYLNAIPQHCRSKFEEDEIPDLMIFFINVNAAGNVEGEPCGLLKMWILPKKKNRTYIHTIKGLHNTFREFKDIKCKGVQTLRTSRCLYFSSKYFTSSAIQGVPDVNSMSGNSVLCFLYPMPLEL